MTAPSLWQVCVYAEPTREERIAAQLEEELQAPVAVYHEAGARAAIASAYLEKITDTPERLRQDLAVALEVAAETIDIRRLRRENWATSWKRHFKPIQIGARLLIKPSWSKRRARPGQRVVILDPGLSFGTGQHETTAFCLRRLTHCRRRGEGQSFLDVGTGSGILAIAAAKLGYAPVEAFDFDPEAVRVARANARKNRVEDRVTLRRDDLTALRGKGGRGHDVICANLTYDLLASEAEKLSRLLAPDGCLIVAGILDEQFSIVTKSLQRFGLTLAASEVKNDWRSGQYAFHRRVQRERKR